MKIVVCVLAMMFGSLVGHSQSSSVGLLGSSIYYQSTSGVQLGLRLKTEIKDKFHVFGEANFISLDDKTTWIRTTTSFDGSISETTREYQTNVMIAQGGVEYKVLSVGKIDFKLSLSGGFMRNSVDYFGLIQGGMSFESKITDQLSIGVPFSYSYVTYADDEIHSLGLRLSYLY